MGHGPTTGIPITALRSYYSPERELVFNIDYEVVRAGRDAVLGNPGCFSKNGASGPSSTNPQTPRKVSLIINLAFTDYGGPKGKRAQISLPSLRSKP